MFLQKEDKKKKKKKVCYRSYVSVLLTDDQKKQDLPLVTLTSLFNEDCTILFVTNAAKLSKTEPITKLKFEKKGHYNVNGKKWRSK